MPIINNSTYPKQPFYYGNHHGHTIIPGAFRKINDVIYERERLQLPDGDFVDLDWIDKRSNNLVLLTHGLAGDSERQYIKGMANLRELDLNDTEISDAGLELIARMTGLETIRLRATKISDEGFVKWIVPMSRLKQLDLRETTVSLDTVKRWKSESEGRRVLR